MTIQSNRIATIVGVFAIALPFTSFAAYMAGRDDGAAAAPHERHSCLTDTECFALYGEASIEPFVGARLIGRDCGWNHATLWAEEEDHFPASGCVAIDAI